MKTLRHTILFLLGALCQTAQAGRNDITVTNHVWEIHKADGEVVELPYYSLQDLSFSRTDLNEVEHADFVKQILTQSDGQEYADMLEDISFMRYVKTTSSVGGDGSDSRTCNPKGFDIDISFPQGSTVSHRQDWTEIEELEDGTIKVKATRNSSVFWRQDTIDITYPNGTTASIPIEQPGDEYFKTMEFGATVFADIENIDYSGGETTSSITESSSFEGSSHGSQNCVFIGKLGDKRHRYVVSIEKHEQNIIHGDEDITEYSDWKLDIDVVVDVSSYPGKVESASIYDYNYNGTPIERETTTIFKATYGEIEAIGENCYEISEQPNSYVWGYLYEIHADSYYRGTQNVLNVLGGLCGITFGY